MMPVALIDPVEQLRRRHWWAGLFLSVLASLHYILAAPAFLFFGVSFLSAASRMVQRLGNWGVVSRWDAQGLPLAMVGLAYGAGTVNRATQPAGLLPRVGDGAPVHRRRGPARVSDVGGAVPPVGAGTV
jgi:hypothetical protein